MAGSTRLFKLGAACSSDAADALLSETLIILRSGESGLWDRDEGFRTTLLVSASGTGDDLAGCWTSGFALWIKEDTFVSCLINAALLASESL